MNKPPPVEATSAPIHVDTRHVAHTGKPGRNDPCNCGSGRKWKKCCGGADAYNADKAAAQAAELARREQARADVAAVTRGPERRRGRAMDAILIAGMLGSGH